MSTIHINEINRLRFLEERDGKEKAIEFALRGIFIYKGTLKTNLGKAFRKQFIASLVIYRLYRRGTSLDQLAQKFS